MSSGGASPAPQPVPVMGRSVALRELRAGMEDDPLIVADGLGWNSDWYDTLGADSNGVVDQIPQFVSQSAQTFQADYERTYGQSPSPSAAGLAYDYFHYAVQVLAAAESSYGAVNRETIRRTMAEQVQTETLTFDEGILMPEYRYGVSSWPDPVVGGDAYTFPVLQYREGQSAVDGEATLSGSASGASTRSGRSATRSRPVLDLRVPRWSWTVGGRAEFGGPPLASGFIDRDS